MNRKNIFVLSAVMFLLVFSMACQSTSRTAVSASDEIVSLMAEMAASREYAALYHLPAAYDETVGAICDGDYSTPSAVYSLDIPENQLPGIDIDDLSVSDGMQAYLRSAAYISFASSVNQHSGVEALSAASAYAAQSTFLCPTVTQTCAYLYVFESGIPIVVFLLPGEDGTVRAIGYFLINDALNTDSPEDIEASLKNIGISGVKVRNP